MHRINEGITTPKGFRAQAVCCGIKKNSLDLALLVSEGPATSAGVFTINKFKAAPVILSKKNLNAKRHRAVIINSGNANCLTGEAGLKDAAYITNRVASLIGCKKEEVLICSTGIIGKRLPLGKIINSIPTLVSSLSKDSAAKAAEAILTTDAFKKEVATSLNLGSRKVIIAGVAKGAGMIAPNMATMLSLISTDAEIDKRLLYSALKEAVESSFNSITVDGTMSTNDSVIIMANGLSGVDVGASKNIYRRFVAGLSYVCLELAKMIVRDGEGATKFIRIMVRSARNKNQAKGAALAVANSNLFKAMCYGENPNFGRIAVACGAFAKGIISSKVDIYLNGKLAVENGIAVRDTMPRKLLKGKDICVDINLNSGDAEATVYTSDLTTEYVRINAEYS